MSEKIWTPERQSLARDSLKKWKGTPHRNRIAVVGVGIDCIQLVHQIICDAKIVDNRVFTGYSLDDGLHGQSERLLECVEKSLFTERVEELEFGDLIIFVNGKMSGHCAFFAGEKIWHSIARGMVIESSVNLWRSQFLYKLRINQCGWRNDPQSTI